MPCTVIYLNGPIQSGKSEIAIGALKQIASLPQGKSILLHETTELALHAKRRFNLDFDVTSIVRRPNLSSYTAVAIEAYCGLNSGVLETMRLEMNNNILPTFIIVVS